MVPISFSRLAILLITALILVQGAAALTIEQAPLNPAFVAYTEGMDNGCPDQSSIDSVDSGLTGGTDAPYATGLLPSPAVAFWPDGYVLDAVIDETALPGYFDLRDEGRVTPVRDQGKCGSCWAFATYGSLESTYLTDTGEAENFSENNMNNLCSNQYPDGFDYAPCKGGVAFMSTAYLTRGSGPVQEADDPYALPYPSNISPTDLPPVIDVLDVSFLPPRTDSFDNSLFKQTLMNEGAIWVAFTVNWSCFADNYTTYYWPGDEYAPNGGHAVTLVGWDDTFPKENFNVTPPGDGAFILKNSWGTGSGDEGFFYISYYDPAIGYFNGEGTNPYDFTYYNTPGALYTGVPAEEDRQIYQYDPLGWTTSIGTGAAGPVMGANVFTADRYEEITDVSFYTREPETEYVAAIFTDFTTPPGDAAPVAWTYGTADMPGYHTVTLPETVPLIPGEIFSVVLMVVSPNDGYPLVVEKPIEGYSSGATAEAGESYVSTDGENWEDLTEIFPDTNICIKAHTSPLTVVPRDYPTIMEAVNAAADGDTIIVESGTYPEELELEQPITLFGVGMPVIATPEDGIGVEIEADNCTISGFSFEGNEGENLAVGISGDDCTLFDTEITGCKFGLYIRDVQGLSLSTITMHDNTYNLIYWDGCENPGNTIDETVTVNGRPVIYREGVSGETIDASSNAGAVICVNSTDITIRDTTTTAMGDGITLLFCRDVCVENVTADKIFSDGVWASSSENITVHDSSFGSDMYRGIFAEETNGLQATGNNFAYRYGGAGVSLLRGNDSRITNNTMSSDEDCMGVVGNEISGLIVAGNTIEGGTGYGIDIIDADMITISDNTMDVTKYGIRIQNVEMATVSDNTVQCNDRGTGMLIVADGAEITDNTIENCSEQARMILNNSVVRGNSFSGTVYPEIILPNPDGDVSVYRNDFILIPGDSAADSITTRITGADTRGQEIKSHVDRRGNDELSWHDALMDDQYHADTFSMIAEISEQDAAQMVEVQNSGIWHSPTEETYWYRGQPFTGFMGNYWSTYNGTDTNHNGIGDAPFTIYGDDYDTYPLVKPFAWYPDKNPDSGSDDPSADMATSPALNAGESATLSFTGSAVQTVTVTAAEGTGRILLTVDQAKNGPDGLEGPVYQYLSAQLTGMADDEITEAVFSFRVSAAWLRAEGVLPTAITLWRFHDNAWQELPTSVLREEGGWVYYEATTPGFSSFAIAAGDGQKVTVTIDAAAPMVGTDTVDVSVTTESMNETATAPQVTVAIPEEEGTGTPTTTPQESPLGLIPLIGGAAGAALLFGKHYENK
ncbi:lectin like domain-containing protein [Methanogenium sp. MK-MG]|uniref:lectin like domain-containing protein n=1 Tax=Methanogenium sp. MK-MG TaxID=2599926 RepID=UPI0013EBBF54|nr:lectin like domain-containing protein [Methanogenium sp. MK-MG]KAF1077498.1 hypothetical protein MKMG_01285 [Methanogenium sp. MK-MG]